MSLHCQGYARFLLLRRITLEVSLGVQGRVWHERVTASLFVLCDKLGVATCLAVCSSEAAAAVPVCWTIWWKSPSWFWSSIYGSSYSWILPAARTCNHKHARSRRCMCMCRQPVYFALGKTDTSAVWLLSEACRRREMNGETVVLCTREPSISCESCNSKHRRLFLLNGG